MSIVRITEKYLQSAIDVNTRVFRDDPQDVDWINQAFTASVYLESNRKLLDSWNTETIRYWGEKRSVGIVGTVGIYTHFDDPSAWLGWFCVDSDFRGQGIGQKLLNFAMDRARTEGFETISLWTSSKPNERAANRMYEKNGLEIYKRKNTGKGYRLLFRERNL